jgi:hypothetical protein
MTATNRDKDSMAEENILFTTLHQIPKKTNASGCRSSRSSQKQLCRYFTVGVFDSVTWGVLWMQYCSAGPAVARGSGQGG